MTDLPAFFDVALKTKTLEVTLTLNERESVTAELVNEERGRRVRLVKNSLILTMPYPVFYRFAEALMKTAERHSKRDPSAKRSIRNFKARYKLKYQRLSAGSSKRQAGSEFSPPSHQHRA